MHVRRLSGFYSPFANKYRRGVAAVEAIQTELAVRVAGEVHRDLDADRGGPAPCKITGPPAHITRAEAINQYSCEQKWKKKRRGTHHRKR